MWTVRISFSFKKNKNENKLNPSNIRQIQIGMVLVGYGVIHAET